MLWSILRSANWLCLLLAGTLLVSACQPAEDKRPDNMIPREQMADILADIHLAEARVSRLGLGSSDSSNIVYKRLEKQILKKFKVNTAAYTDSYIYYSAHPVEMDTLYKRVLEILKKKAAVKPPVRS